MVRKTGNARTTASRSSSRPAGRMRRVVNTGPSTSAGPFSLKAQEADPELQETLKPTRRRRQPETVTVRSSEYATPIISGPYWSHAARAYRIEFFQSHRRWPSKQRQSSFYCSEHADAIKLMESARSVKSWEAWLELRSVAALIAVDRRDGFLYRIMSGEREVFIPQKG